MTIDRSQLKQQNRIVRRADDLRRKIDGMAKQVGKLDGHGKDLDPRVDAVTLKDTVPEPSALGRFLSRQSPVTGEVNLKGGQPLSASLDTDYGFVGRGRYQLSTADNGDKTYTLTELHIIGEEVVESYTFGANDTLTVHTRPPETGFF